MNKYITGIAKVLASLNAIWSIFALMPSVGRIDGATGAMHFNNMLVALLLYFVISIVHQVVESLSDS
jgi:hypothetical protein